MEPEDAGDGDVPAVPQPAEEPPPPPEPEVEEPVTSSVDEANAEEEYEELIEPERPRKPRKKRKHLGAIITVIVIVIILAGWTFLSPRVLPQQGKTYIDSTEYANLASFNGTHDSWAATTTWGISVSGPDDVQVGQEFSITILVTKVSEQTSNFWFIGTSISVTNMTVMNGSGRILAVLGNTSSLGFGEAGTLRLSLSEPGDYSLMVTVQFLVYTDMRIGFLPVEKINLEPLDLKTIAAH